jgi:DNA-binding MarR family transcriptional regulator
MTPAGKKELERLRRLSAELEDEFMSSLDESEREQLHSLLLRLAEQHLPNCRSSVFPPKS